MRIITLLTDFGTVDSYVAEVKAVILSRAPEVTLVDISHDVPPGDIRAAQYLLSRAWKRFPVGTIHLAIVDPAVGTERRALVAEAGGHRFLAPDNGLLSFLPPDARFVALPVPRDAAPTFHGRDVFAPAGSALPAGEPCGQATGGRCGGGGSGLGRPITRWRRNLHLRHHSIGETGARRKLRQLDQLENHFALALGLDTAKRAIGQVHRPRGGKQPLRPKLDFVSREMHGEVSHWLVLRPPVGTGFTNGALPGSRAIH